MTADPRPAARIVNPAAVPLDPSPLSNGCPICGRHNVNLTRHHVVPRSQGGDDVRENLIWACGDGSRGCHGVLESHNRDGETGLDYRTCGELLILYLDTIPAVREYAERKKYQGWLEDTYLPLSEDPIARAEWLRSQGRDDEADVLLTKGAA